MAKITADHPKLQSFTQHGVVFDRIVGNQGKGSCPFCGKPKFYANVETRAWDCKTCGRKGGLLGFLEVKAELNQSLFKGKTVLKLSKDRGIKNTTLRAWGVGWDGRHYTIPVNGTGNLVDLRRYTIKGRNLSTTGSKVGLVGKNRNSEIVWLCEGEWDGMALWEVLKSLDRKETVFSVTGALSFPGSTVSIFRDREVRICFDNDEAGQKGAERVQSLLKGVAKEIKFVEWPEEVPDEFDIRDLYRMEGEETVDVLEELLTIELPMSHRGDDAQPQHGKPIHPTGKGSTYTKIVQGYRKWLHIPNAEVLAVLYGSILANRLPGDPLWMFLVAPPGGMKSELLMSFTGAPLIFTLTSMTPHALISGANFIGGGDPSLIPKLNDKVLIIKDFTSILSMPLFQRDEIFGTLRDAYDGRIERTFGNGVHRAYDSKFGIVAGVTPIIESLSHSSSILGERFLKYRIKQPGRISVGSDVIMQALENIAHENTMRDDLRGTAKAALDYKIPSKLPQASSDMNRRFMKLAQWVAALRGVVSRERYTREIIFKPVAEIGTRLAKQFAKLAIGIALLQKKKKIDEEIYRIITRVARDTAPDRVEEIVRQLYLKSKDDFVPTRQISEWSRFPTGTISNLLQDLNLLHIVQREDGSSQGSWRLSRSMLKLMKPIGVYAEEETWKAAKRGRKRSRKGP